MAAARPKILAIETENSPIGNNTRPPINQSIQRKLEVHIRYVHTKNICIHILLRTDPPVVLPYPTSPRPCSVDSYTDRQVVRILQTEQRKASQFKMTGVLSVFRRIYILCIHVVWNGRRGGDTVVQ